MRSPDHPRLGASLSAMKLGTRVNLLLYTLILVTFVSFLPPLAAYLGTSAPLSKIERGLGGVVYLHRLDVLITRQAAEYMDIVLVGEDAERLAEEVGEMARTRKVVGEVLGALADAARGEPRLEEGELESVEALAGSYDELCEEGDAIVGMTRRGEIEPAFARLRESMRRRREAVWATVDRAVSLEVRAIGADLDRLLVAAGRFAFLPAFEIESTVCRLRLDTDRALAAALFARSLEQLMGEYVDAAFLGEPRSLLFFVRRQTDQALEAWRLLAGPDGPEPAPARRRIDEISVMYQEFTALGENLLELAATAERDAVLGFFEHDFEPVADESLAGLVDTAYAAHEADARADLEASMVLFRRAGGLVTLLALLLFTLALSARVLMSRWIVKPVSALAATTKVWADGDLSRRAPVLGGGELGELTAELNRMAAALEEAREQLHRQARLPMLGELAGNVGHEIRNPLAVIKNSCYFLHITQTAFDDKVREHLAIIWRQVLRVNRLITELLDFTREPHVEIARFELRQACDQALAAVDVPDSIRIERHVEDALEVEADPGQIERCLANLVSNAVQAMPEGGVLGLECGRRNGEISVAVTDTGIGIAAENLESIFEPLYTSKSVGIGLGLPVARRYTQINHGRLECESTPGQGTTFRLILPVPEGCDG